MPLQALTLEGAWLPSPEPAPEPGGTEGRSQRLDSEQSDTVPA